MCLGKVYDNEQGKPLMEDVTSFARQDGKLVFTSIFGDQITVDGEVENIDFGDSKIIIKKA